MKRLLRWTSWSLVTICALSGAAAIASLGSPMQVVLPLRLLIAITGGVLVVLAGTLRLLGCDYARPLIVALAGLALLGFYATRILALPECRDFTVANGSVQLAGSACYPSGEQPVPTAVFVHGSGVATRNEHIFYAEVLARDGIAAVVYDKRGAGSSTGQTYEVGYSGYANDLVAVAEWARGQGFSDDSAIGFVGYSEAEWVMPLAAQRFPARFIVVVGASGLSPLGQVSEEIEIRLRARGFGEEDVEEATETNVQLGRYVRDEISADQFEELLEEAKGQAWFEPAADLPDDVYPREDYEWWGTVMDFDPADAWSRYRGPVLFLKGTADDRSYADRSVERVRGMLGDPRRQLTIRLFEGADHALLLWPLGNRVPPPMFPENYPEIVGNWIAEQASAREDR